MAAVAVRVVAAWGSPLGRRPTAAVGRAGRGSASAAGGPSGAAVLTDTGNPLVRATEAAKAEAEDRSALHVERDFISEDEEERLVGEANRRLRTFPYQEGHFDDVIHGYRELLGFKHIAPESAAVLARAEAQTRHLCGDDPAFEFLPVHILDLHADGYILPHLDSYCGRTVAAVSLVSETVMRLTRPDRPDAVVELYLPRRSFYALRGPFRYTYRHEICRRPLAWRGRTLEPGRRLSLIFRERDPNSLAKP